MTSILNQLASASQQREQDLNILLAQKIAADKDKKAIGELIEGLEHKTKAIRHDCIKTLYETASLAPQLCQPYTAVFIALLQHKDNRMQWGAMTALSAMASGIPEQLAGALDQILATVDRGSVITRDHGVRILASLSSRQEYADTATPLLLEQILQAPVNQVPSYAEQALPVVCTSYQDRFRQILHIRLKDMDQESKKKRVEKVLKKLQ